MKQRLAVPNEGRQKSSHEYIRCAFSIDAHAERDQPEDTKCLHGDDVVRETVKVAQRRRRAGGVSSLPLSESREEDEDAEGEKKNKVGDVERGKAEGTRSGDETVKTFRDEEEGGRKKSLQ